MTLIHNALEWRHSSPSARLFYDDAELWCFNISLWINFIITQSL